jgi:hypothetical protein
LFKKFLVIGKIVAFFKTAVLSLKQRNVLLLYLYKSDIVSDVDIILASLFTSLARLSVLLLVWMFDKW